MSKNRIATNSILLYLRMVFVMLLNLISVRLVLKGLGVSDYGINDVVAGVITTLSSLTSVLSTATQRYYSISIGKGDFHRLNQIFSTSLKIYIIFSFIVFILGESIGVWLINNKLNIPFERMHAAFWVYQFSIFSFIFSFLQIPYSSAVIAFEDMNYFAAISIVEAILKIIAAFSLTFLIGDRLVIYGFLLMFISFFVLITYVSIGRKKYSECRYRKVKDGIHFKELISFSGWSLFGSLAGVGMNQIITILVNIYFGPVVNTARAISLQFNLAFTSLTASFLMAIRPQMISSFALESYDYLNRLFGISNKIIFYTMLMICLPLFVEMESVLRFWIKNAEPQTILLSRLIIIYAFIMALNNPISIIIQATGKVKQYHIAVEFITLSCVPITYLLFKMGFPVYSSYLAMIASALFAHIVRLVCLKKFYFHFCYKTYISDFLLPAILILLLSISIVSVIVFFIKIDFYRILSVFISSILFVLFFFYFLGLNKSDRIVLQNFILVYIKNISN
jgi:O-antigen/teichoic acid export membrane protein